MRLRILDIPDDPQILPAWLERSLVGLELGDLIAELDAVHEAPTDDLSLDDVLGSQRADVLESGLGVLNADQISSLMTHPRLLFDLQEEVLIHAASFWSALQKDNDELTAVIDRDWQRLQEPLAEAETTSNLATGCSTVVEPISGRDALERPLRKTMTFRSWSAVCAVILLVGIGIGLFLRQPVTSGWSSPGALVQRDHPAATFAQLAKAASSYIEATRSTPAELQHEIERFVRDCERVRQLTLPELAAIPHPDSDLPDSQIATYADWLNVKCEAWSGKAQTVLTALQHESSDFETANRDYTQILTKLKSALEKQAATLS